VVADLTYLTAFDCHLYSRGRGIVEALAAERGLSVEEYTWTDDRAAVLIARDGIPFPPAVYQGDRLVYANPAGLAFTGYSMGELLTKNFWEMVHPGFRELVRTYGLARQKGEQVPTTYEVRYITKSGQERWAEFSAGRIEYKGKPAGIVTAVDTTERKRDEMALREAKRQAELYLDLMGPRHQ
jgi:PAS domain S-box-containing protein